MTTSPTLTIDGRVIPLGDERNLLEVIRKAGIDLPTFCYHSDLSVYGACRLCLVEIQGRGIQGACSTPPEAGLVIRTNTEQLREIRRISVELLLANEGHSCSTCGKGGSCQLQSLARRLGVKEIRFKPVGKALPLDKTSPSLVRDPNKCILCGDCVRMCSEVQGIGAIGFAHRGSRAAVVPAFGRDLAAGECVYCGQCASVCPTGALTPKSDVEAVWKALDNATHTVVAQVAPAVRVALGEHFGMPAGEVSIGQIVTALRRMGFARVYDTAFSADLTVVEEATEFLTRKQSGERLPQFTSCCPAWVKFAEQYYPDLLPNLSSCRSPQQMLGSLVKDQAGRARSNTIMVAIMPCTAKKFEAGRPEFSRNDVRDVDYALTTQELARMIEEAGLSFRDLPPDSFDLPFGFKTGAGVIFGNSGGVTEAVLRFASEKLTGVRSDTADFHEIRGTDGIREITLRAGDTTLNLAVVSGLKNARIAAERIRAGTADWDLVEVMACPGGCIGGAGQPVSRDPAVRTRRTRGLYQADKMLDLHNPQENHFVTECYTSRLGTPGSHVAHELLHTHYHHRRRGSNDDLALTGSGGDRLPVNVCVGTSCFVRGSQNLLKALAGYVDAHGLSDRVDVHATFCFETCNRGPTVRIGSVIIEQCTIEKALSELTSQVEARLPSATA